MFNGILYAIIAFLIPVLCIFAGGDEYTIMALLISSLVFNIYLVVHIHKSKKQK